MTDVEPNDFEGSDGESSPEVADCLKERIVNAFIERARLVGVRAVSTDEMAKTLSMSKKTLYKQFRSKEELVGEVLNRWEAKIIAIPPITETGAALKDVVRNSVERWYDNDAQFTPKFWEEISSDYPALKEKYFNAMYASMRQVGVRLRPYRKAHLSEPLVRQVYFMMVLRTVEPEFYQRAEVSRKDAVMNCLDIWLDGCFDWPNENAPQQSEDNNDA